MTPRTAGKQSGFSSTMPCFMRRRLMAFRPYKAPGIEEAPWTRPEAADIILKNSGAVIRIGGDRAFYSPLTDHIQLPPEDAFSGPAEFAATALHELGHWTGHPSRLNRDHQNPATAPQPMRWKNCAPNWPPPSSPPNSVFPPTSRSMPATSTTGSSRSSDDKREIFRAAADAQKIVDMLLGFHPDYAAQAENDPARPAPRSANPRLTFG